jgi:hypothetical protein
MYLPRPIFDKVSKEFNCEDIAMSFMISSYTGGRPPLLADLWAMKSMIKMDTDNKISGSKGHKRIRDECVNSFAEILGLKKGPNRLQLAKYLHGEETLFDCGMPPEGVLDAGDKSDRQVEFETMIQRWRTEAGRMGMQKEWSRMMSATGAQAYKHGLIEKTDKWKERQSHHQ